MSTRRLFGFLMASAAKRKKPAAVPPSRTRWSNETGMVAGSLSMIRPTPTIATTGWLTIAAEPSTPNIGSC